MHASAHAVGIKEQSLLTFTHLTLFECQRMQQQVIRKACKCSVLLHAMPLTECRLSKLYEVNPNE